MVNEFINVDPEICSGVPVFRGTRVFVATLFDYLESGETIEEFLSDFPSVSRAQIEGVLECAKIALIT